MKAFVGKQVMIVHDFHDLLKR